MLPNRTVEYTGVTYNCVERGVQGWRIVDADGSGLVMRDG